MNSTSEHAPLPVLERPVKALPGSQLDAVLQRLLKQADDPDGVISAFGSFISDERVAPTREG